MVDCKKMEETPPGRKNWKLIPILETGGWTRQSRFLPRAREGGWYINERVFISMTGYEYNGTKIGRSEPYTYFMKP